MWWLGSIPSSPRYDVSAPLVFVGYGLESPPLGIDDYRGLDVRGKIVVTLRGYPKGMPSEEGAHLSSTKGRSRRAAWRDRPGIDRHQPIGEDSAVDRQSG